MSAKLLTSKKFPNRIIPRRIVRPCDHGLRMAVIDLETQLGSVEAFNRLIATAERLKNKIDKGDVQAQNPIYATSIKG